MDILEQIRLVLADVFDDDELAVTEETTAEDIDGWDSFAQMQIIAGVEETFDIHFTIEEVVGFKSVGDMVKTVEEHLEG
ncbi:MAG: acyl carrier protein [Lachnospiraceae bacterium]|nr:acyl carrier protein [Lachnospiraceae bacterium]